MEITLYKFNPPKSLFYGFSFISSLNPKYLNILCQVVLWEFEPHLYNNLSIDNRRSISN